LKNTIFASALAILVGILIHFSCSSDNNPYKQGKILYTNFCANCHMESGEGLKGLIPPLAKADYLKAYRSELACGIRNGMAAPVIVNGVLYDQQVMLAIKKLSDFEITNVLNYVATAWGNNEKIWTIDEVRTDLERCK
jgi:cytochrome c551